MTRKRFRFGLRALMASIACLAVVFAGVRAWKQWEPAGGFTYWVSVVPSDGSVRALSVSREVYRLIGRRCTTDRLIEILEARKRDAKTQPRSSQKPSQPTETQVTAAAYLLGKVRDPRAFESLTELLDDPLVENRWAAAYALAEFGDARAIPNLRAQLTDAAMKAVAGYALGTLGDLDSAVPALIDSMDRSDHYGAWFMLDTIEEVTGLRLTDIRGDWHEDLTRVGHVDEFKKAVRLWWEKHKSESPYATPGGGAGP